MEILKLRKDTQTPRETMWQAFKVGLAMFLVLFLAIPSLMRNLEGFRDLDNSIQPEFRIFESDGRWYVNYRSNATYPVKAHFTIQTRDDLNQVICTYRSINTWRYGPNTNRRKIWTWAAWSESHNAGSCALPSAPFRMCLRFDGHGQYGEPFDTEFFCEDYPGD